MFIFREYAERVYIQKTRKENRPAVNMNISAMILTGGKSSRMGQDKARLIQNGESFLEHLIVEMAVSASPGRTVITELFLSAAREGDYADTGLPVVPDEHQGIGPIEGIRRGLIFAREEYLFVCAVDMPFVRREMVDYLAGLVSPEYDAYVFREESRIYPVCAIYHRRVLLQIDKMIRESRYRLRDLLSRVRTRYVDAAGEIFGDHPFMNINTPEEYHQAAAEEYRP